ncbi:WSC domain-containing protein [Phlyctema vagabunda]|uniref:Peroxidase n=1 Tax=Phlyctema vagabunda TaxID=108571 RepID=A0ABR4PP78_9HELO
MSTYSTSTGLGGLDASIMYETEREENIGTAFNTTLSQIAGYYSTRSSMSDLLALAVHTATRSCGGPEIEMRFGRVDALEPGILGVPEPQEEIESLTDKFSNQGFSTQEMITLVACGHTLGGVHGADFPTIVPGAGNNGNNFSHFDSTATSRFDNRVVVEYLQGNSTNPLLVGPDPLRNSDAKVFAADGNVTMERLTDPDIFQEDCKSVFQKMIDTVPKGVVLSEPIQPYEVKPAALNLALDTEGNKFIFSGDIRVRTTVRPASEISSVSLVYKNRDGSAGGQIPTLRATFQGGSGGSFDENFQWYGFSTNLTAASSISSFNVVVTLTNGAIETHDNNGVGFPVQDLAILQTKQSCNFGDTAPGKSYISIHKSRTSKPVFVAATARSPRQGVVVPDLVSWNTEMSPSTGNSTGEYTLYTTKIIMNSIAQTQNTVLDIISGAEGEDQVIDSFKNVGLFGVCAA